MQIWDMIVAEYLTLQMQATSQGSKAAPPAAAAGVQAGGVSAALPANPPIRADPQKPAPETSAVASGQSGLQDVEMADPEEASTSKAVDVSAHVGQLTGRVTCLCCLLKA